MADKMTGKASYVNYGGVTLKITKYSAKSTRKLANTSDTGDYDEDADLIFESQLPVSATQELTVEGNFRRSQTSGTLIAALFDGAEAVPVVLGLDAGTLLGHGNYDISDFTCDVPAEDTVTWSATMKLNGKFTPGA